MTFNMKKMLSILLIVFAFLVPYHTVFSDDKKNDEKNKAYLLQDIFLMNKQIAEPDKGVQISRIWRFANQNLNACGKKTCTQKM